MRQRDYVKRAERRVKNICDKGDATILRTITRTIQALEREKVEYTIRQQRRRKAKR